MTAPLVTIKVRAGHHLAERIANIARSLDVQPTQFIEYAIESELQRQESHLLKEDIALEELRNNILHTGQALQMDHPTDEAADVGRGIMATCELCMKRFPLHGQVEGPPLCDPCMELARGAGLDGVDAGGRQ